MTPVDRSRMAQLLGTDHYLGGWLRSPCLFCQAFGVPVNSLRPSCAPARGHSVLDQELPGAGWPHGCLTEILQAQPGLHKWRLLLPVLRQAVVSGPLERIGSPYLPNLRALASLGIPAARLLLVEARTPAEQVLRSCNIAAQHESSPEPLRISLGAARPVGCGMDWRWPSSSVAVRHWRPPCNCTRHCRPWWPGAPARRRFWVIRPCRMRR